MKGMFHRAGKIACVALIAMYVLPGLAISDDLVLCMAEDGRMSVEEAKGGRCVSAHDAPCGDADEGAAGCPASPRECCGSCLDIPISLSSPHAIKVPAAVEAGPGPTVVLAACGAFYMVMPDLPCTSARRPDVNPVARSALSLIRTVVIIS